jgi:hypothetical protein
MTACPGSERHHDVLIENAAGANDNARSVPDIRC